MLKPRYVVKALAFYKVFKSFSLKDKDLNVAEKKSNFLDERKEEFRLIVGMAKDTLSGKYKMSKWNMSVVVGTILYVISPLDAIPDVVPVLGWLDDVSIITYALSKLKDEIQRYQKTKIGTV